MTVSQTDMQFMFEFGFLMCLVLIVVLALVLAKEIMELATMMQQNKNYKKIKAELKAVKKARTQELKEFLNLKESKKENIACTEDDVAFLYEGEEDGRPR